jgi:hypothetical protein
LIGLLKILRRWLEIPLSAPPVGPNNMAWLEAGLTAFADTTLPEPLKLQLLLNLSLYVIGRCRFLKDITSNAEDDDYTTILSRVLDPGQYPALMRAISHQAFDEDEIDWEEADFTFCLARLLDGYDRFMEMFTGS